jgi:hypothetical protein
VFVFSMHAIFFSNIFNLPWVESMNAEPVGWRTDSGIMCLVSAELRLEFKPGESQRTYSLHPFPTAVAIWGVGRCGCGRPAAHKGREAGVCALCPRK